jgi:outer membrane receptor protein involved in Fe transport
MTQPQRKLVQAIAGLLAVGCPLLPVLAQQAQPPGAGQIEEQVIFGRATDLFGRADAASEGSISGADLLIRPMLKTAELLESMPGMVAVQHSGSGKANQYFLRGFNLDHGTDYTAHFDGVPMNLRSHGHGQGYLDINGIIPETIEGIDYRKGPYRADLGDFALAGASFIRTIDRVERSFLSTETGQYGWRRAAGGHSADLAGGTLTLVGEAKRYDGAWQRPEDLQHEAVWLKYLRDTDFGRLTTTLSLYDATWRPTEQVPERALNTPVCADAFCSLDPTADGHTRRWILNTQLRGSDWDANLFFQHYDWDMKSNPTYDYQIGQFDERRVLGGAASRSWGLTPTLDLSVGGNFRYDDVTEVGVSHFNRGRFVEAISDNAVAEGSAGVFTELGWQLADDWRLLLGTRFDHYDFDVTARIDGSAAGEQTASLASPKAGLAWLATDRLELYANWGRGFHSNDARGVVNTSAPVPGLSPGTGHELGARFGIGDVKLTASYWWLRQQSELIFVGDSNAVEPKGASRREGAELTLFWQPLPWLGVDAVYTTSKARYVDNPEGDYVQGALEEAGQIGLSATSDAWDFSLRARYMGPYALLPDNSERADPLLTVSTRAARHFDLLTVYAEFINLLDSDKKEIVYSYPAFVAGLDPAGLSADDIDCSMINCRMSRVTEPRTFRLGISYKFR